MSDSTKTPIQIIREWWGVVVVFLGIVGGYAWLDEQFDSIDEHFAKIKELEAQKEEFERKLSVKDCELQYTIEITHEEAKYMDDDVLKDDVNALMPDEDDPTAKALEEREDRKRTVRLIEQRNEARLKSIACLMENRASCDKNPEVAIGECSYLEFPE